MGIFCRLAVFFLRKEWRNTAFSSLLSFRLSVASCCCHCSCFQQQQLLQAAIAMDDATGILLHSLKRPILHSACSGDRTVKRHEPYKYMWLLWVSSDMKHHPQRLLATRNGSSYVGRQVPFGADFWLWSAASREQYSPSTIPISILPVAEITVRRHSDQIISFLFYAYLCFIYACYRNLDLGEVLDYLS